VKTLIACMLIPFASAAAPVCEPLQGKIPPGGASFVHRHKVYEVVEGGGFVADQLILWDRQPESLCFFVTTVHRNLHYCWLVGRAERQRSGTYTYEDKSCKVVLEVRSNRVSMNVTDPSDSKREGCNPEETEAFSCGMNTWIPSATYVRERR
jgi:hypothetical protein